MNQDVVHWSLSRWAADLFHETLTRDSRSAAFDPKLREQLARALRLVTESDRIRDSKPPDAGFDLFRLSKSKDVVDVSANTLRAYNREGLPFYKQGKAIFVSKTELAAFIRFRSKEKQQPDPC
jgi:hypothetical protein